METVPNPRRRKRNRSKIVSEVGPLTPLYKNAKRGPITQSANGIIAKLPAMSLSDTLRSWRNALSALNDPSRKRLHKAARDLLDAIDFEWKRRGAGPARPEDWFEWPSIIAAKGPGSLTSSAWLEEGVLKYLGYKVGKNSDLSAPLRAAILTRVFVGQIPPAFPAAYLREWGEPSTAARLNKMADSLAAFVRNARRRDEDLLRHALADWEHDLEFLYDEYYVGKFLFAWPVTR